VLPVLRGIIICPDTELSERFQNLLSEVGHVHVTRALDRYPSQQELLRFLRAHAPQVLFVAVDSMPKLQEIVREVERNIPGVQIFALGRQCDPQILLDVMRAGIREYAALPFDRQNLKEALIRINDTVEAKPPAVEAADHVFSFLPSKAGVGTSTIALNAAVALSHLPNTSVLLSDFDLNSGMIRFMLKLDNSYGVTDAAEHALNMDESLWPPMVSSIERLDVLHAGRLNPDFRIEPAQIRHLLDFMRRNYQVLCFDLSGNLEKYSLEIMHESRKIFLVCTAEIPSLHLAREKYLYLKQLDLHDRVCVLLNRYHKRSIISSEQIEQLLGVPVHMTFPNDYHGVHRALTFGRWVEPASELGRQFNTLAHSMVQPPSRSPKLDTKKRFLEYFSVVPGRIALSESKKSVV
jgi:pilus assembly protein CpaE